MYSISISSITFTVSFAGFRSSPNPYIRFRTERQKESSSSVAYCGFQNTLTLFRKQSFQVGLSLRSGRKTPCPRVSAPTGGVYRICITRRCMCGRETSSPIGSVRSRVGGCCVSGDGRRCRPMLWRDVGVVGPCCAVSGDCGGWVGVRRVGSRCLGVRCWGVSIRIGARLTRIVVRHGAQLATSGARHEIDLAPATKTKAKIPDEKKNPPKFVRYLVVR